jgi:RTX calcium-binding nonapeptide repeat (4 copies)
MTIAKSPALQTALASLYRDMGNPALSQKIEDAFNQSPALVSQFNAAFAAGELNGFEWRSNGTGASFNPNPNELRVVLTPEFLSRPEMNVDSLIYVLSHEVRHGINAAQMALFDQAWALAITQRVQSWDTTVNIPQDLTDDVRAYQQQHLADEGASNLQAVNSLLGKYANGDLLGQQQIAAMMLNTTFGQAFFTKDPQTGLWTTREVNGVPFARDEDGYLSMTGENIALAASVQGQRPTSTTGATYNQFYVSDPIGAICRAKAGEPFSLNYDTLGLAQKPDTAPDQTPFTSAEVSARIGAAFQANNADLGPTGTCTVIDATNNSQTLFIKSGPKAPLTVLSMPVEALPGDNGVSVQYSFDGDGNLVSIRTETEQRVETETYSGTARITVSIDKVTNEATITTTQSDGSRRAVTNRADGSVEAVVVGANGITDTRTVSAPYGGQSVTTNYSLTGRVETVTVRQTDDDGNVMSTTTHADGRTTIVVRTPEGGYSTQSLPAPTEVAKPEAAQAVDTTPETPQQTAADDANADTDNPSTGGLNSDTSPANANQYTTAPPSSSGSGSGSGGGGTGSGQDDGWDGANAGGSGFSDPSSDTSYSYTHSAGTAGSSTGSDSSSTTTTTTSSSSGSSSSSSSDPIILDLDANGIHLSSPTEGVLADVSGTGWLQPVGWVADGDAFLAFDANYNAQIDGVSEIQFTQLTPGATTDLAGLRALDEDGDGALTAADAAWAQLRVWQDGNRNAVAEAGEVRTLSEVGISSINLRSNNLPVDQNGNVIHGTGSATQTGGGSVMLGDVSLSVLDLVATTSLSGVAGQTVRRPILTSSQTLFNGSAANESVSMTTGRDIAWGRGGNDYLAGSAGDDIAFGGEGNDVLLRSDESLLTSVSTGETVTYTVGVSPGYGKFLSEASSRFTNLSPLYQAVTNLR